MRTIWLVCGAVLAAAVAGCPSVDVNSNDTAGKLPALDGPTVQFDPTNNIIPFPNNLVRSNGKVALPAQCDETPIQTLTRTELLNTLDGFGNYESSLTATFTATPDAASLTGNVVLYERLSRGSATDPTTAKPIPATLLLTKTTQFSVDCSTSKQVDELVIIPDLPLDEKSTYDVAILQGVTTGGSAFIPSATWALVRQADDPVTVNAQGEVVASSTPIQPSQGSAAIAQLLGLNLLWEAHAQAMQFLTAAGHVNTDVLLAWEFTTQTATDPLDSTVANSPANLVSMSVPPLQGTTSILGAATGEQFMNAAIPNACQNQGGYLPCQAVGNVVAGAVLTVNFQTSSPNPLGSAACPTGLNCGPIPGPWTDPLNPTIQNAQLPVTFLAVIPAAGCGSAGCPTVVFGHGLGSSKSSLLAIAPTFAALGFATVGIDFVNSGSRAVLISTDPAIECGSGSGQPATLDPTANHQCFAGILSTNLAQTRDNFRQSVLDVQRLVLSTKACGPTGCGPLSVDPAHVVYAGISLGGIMGTVITATADVNTALLSVPGIGWLDVLENTADYPDIACPLVDNLIAAGVLTGSASNLTYDAAGNATVTTGLCTEFDTTQTPPIYAWREQPGYQQFAAIARWALDPGDPANYVLSFLGTKKVLEEEVVGDQVVSNVAGTNEGELLGLTHGSAAVDPASVLVGGTPSPTPVLATATTSTWLQYSNVAEMAEGSAVFPGNAYQHAALLEPAESGSDALPAVTVLSPFAGVLGTIQMQTDGVTFLTINQ